MSRIWRDLPPHPVYYRIYLGSDDKYIIVSMQDFDEYDYDQSRFLDEQRYSSELEAQRALDEAVGKAVRLLARAAKS